MTKNTKGIIILFAGVIMWAVFGIMPSVLLGIAITGADNWIGGIIAAVMGIVGSFVISMAITQEIYGMETKDEG